MERFENGSDMCGFGSLDNNIVTVKSGLEVNRDYQKWYYSKAWARFPICKSIVTMVIFCIISEIKWNIGENSDFTAQC